MIRRPLLSQLFPVILVIALIGPAAVAGAQTDSAGTPPLMATGTVFEDRNGNRLRDAGEPGLAGVLVSNGLEVVRSDPEGRYSLPIAGITV